VGPTALADGGEFGGESTARSTSSSSSPVTRSRQNVSLSRMRRTVQPFPRTASSNASRAWGTLGPPARVNKSRSLVGREVRSCAANAAPPASKNPSLWGSEKNSFATVI
jgi:hypothetical protein